MRYSSRVIIIQINHIFSAHLSLKNTAVVLRNLLSLKIQRSTYENWRGRQRSTQIPLWLSGRDAHQLNRNWFFVCLCSFAVAHQFVTIRRKWRNTLSWVRFTLAWRRLLGFKKPFWGLPLLAFPLSGNFRVRFVQFHFTAFHLKRFSVLIQFVN